MTELTELQFRLLKGMIAQGIKLALSPDNLFEDTKDQFEARDKNKALLDALVELGFMENITETYREALDDIRKTGKRTFEMYKLTELAVKMFTPPEGAVN